MNSIDFTPLYRSTIGFDRLPSLLDKALRTEATTSNYPPYDIEMVSENKYAISLAVAGFNREELDIQVEKGVLTVRGNKAEEKDSNKEYLYQGIATRSFERKFNLADHVEVTGADLNNGLLTIQLVKELPEEMKPRTIAINADNSQQLEHKKGDNQKAA
ncbi:Hsp20 family protein [Lacimicrobium alkaliphilum]|uniref:Heat-shock protein n=1 Tax=Lacimicrobium alkaliphilum TaxID=1526571 RepID=A0A0U3BD44_9ALTE|nr:Hsp20 family protein [Lacimicrobium alkaliphilum]ALS99589.1 heat-shock protein [Lacimicrobium alkaliphilum]